MLVTPLYLSSSSLPLLTFASADQPYDSIVNTLKVPYGFSSFPLEIYSSPKEWIKTTGNLVYYREHDKVSLLSFRFASEFGAEPS